MNTSCILTLSTYKLPGALRFCVGSVVTQTMHPREIFIVDDGSGTETGALIDVFRKQTKVPVKYARQMDNGYRISVIRSETFAAAQGNYLIQTDDVLLFYKRFIEDHLNFTKPGCFVSGARRNIDKKTTVSLLQNHRTPGLYSHSAGIKKRYNAFRIFLLSHLNSIIQSSLKNIYYMLGCKMAFWKTDLLKVNSYNENFASSGKGNHDIARRLLHANVWLCFLKFAGIVFYLCYNEIPKPELTTNKELLRKILTQKILYTENGISCYLN